jgi:RNA polymerase sigma-70 factor (ECF subfamily)
MGSRDRERLFDTLYAEHQRPLHAYFVGRTADRELALDLLQELFMRVWRSVQTLEALPDERRHHWLYAVARNLVVDTYRSRGAGQAAYERLQRLAQPAHADAADAHVVGREQLSEIDTAIRRLPEDLRVVLVLQVLGERTSAEIGEIVGRPAGTVRYQLAQARRRLAVELELERAPGR